MTLLFTIILIAAGLLVAAGVYSLIMTHNLMRILISVEILTKAATLAIIGAGYSTGKMALAESFVITIIVIEVMLLVIATGILFAVYKHNGSLHTKDLNNLKG